MIGIADGIIAAMCEDVAAKRCSGDINRNCKLLEKQKADKRKIRSFGKKPASINERVP